MPTELCWVANTSVSCFHAVAALVAGRPTAHQTLTDALAEPAAELARRLGAWCLEPGPFLGHVVPLSLGVDSERELVRLALLKSWHTPNPAEEMIGELAVPLSAAKRAQAQVFPDLLGELETRTGPLLELWQARGPGLLAGVGRLTERELIVEHAEVLPVLPCLGGGGEAHLPYNSVRIEAVLTNPLPELPEVVRLGWLLAQLNQDLPRYSDRVPRDRLPLVAALAMIPPTLAAAAEVELLRDTPSTLTSALSAWQLTTDSQGDLATVIATWWQTYQDSRPPWGVALAALDEMLLA